MQNDTTIDREGIRQKLRQFGATQEEAAIACGVSRPTVSLWLKGEVTSPALNMAIPAFTRGLEIGWKHRDEAASGARAA